MRNIKPDAMKILAEACMEENQYDVVQSFKDVNVIDDLLGIMKVKSILNLARGRRRNVEKRFDEIFRARILASAEERKRSSTEDNS